MHVNPKIRKIIAIIVILLFIAGLSIGSYFLYRKFVDPCSGQPGKKWDKTLKMCVLDSCEDGQICKNPKVGVNKCITNNYCDVTSDDGYKYKYDPDSCMCKLDCSSLGADYQGFTVDGRNEVPMQDQGDGTFKPQNDDKLFCGTTCSYSTVKGNESDKNIPDGGKEWCRSDYLCGRMIDQQETILYPGKCFPNNNYENCGDSTICSPTKCVKTQKGERCESSVCDGSADITTGVPCLIDNDCYKDGTINPSKNYTCNKYKPSLGTNGKNFQSVGICDGTDILITNADYCKKIENIGEDEYGNPIDCVNNKGISNRIQQCKNAIKPGSPIIMSSSPPGPTEGNACAINGICTKNPWQAKPWAASTPQCLKSTVTKCPTTGVDCDLLSNNTQCCENVVNQGGANVCCTQTKTESPGCLLTTDQPYDASMVGAGTIGSPIIYDKSTIADLNTKFRKSLGVNPNDPNFSLIACTADANKKRSTCGGSPPLGTKQYLYGQCGSQAAGVDVDYTINTGPTIKGCTENKTTEICVANKTCAGGGAVWSSGSEIDTPICESGGNKYWSAAAPIGATTKFTIDFSDKSGKPCTPTNIINDTINDTWGIDDFTPNAEYTSATFDVNCSDYKISLPSGPVNWSDLKSPATWKSPTNQTLFTENNVRIMETKAVAPGPAATRGNPYPVVNGGCKGNTHGFPPKIVDTGRLFNSATSDCNIFILPTKYNFMHWDGRVCPKGLDTQGECA